MPKCYLLSIALSILLTISATAQLPYNLMDARTQQPCLDYNETIDSKPPEVLFGIRIKTTGEVCSS